jgi:hypothetical protein
LWLYSVGRELIWLYSVARKLIWLYSVTRELMWLYSVARELMWLYSVTRELMWLYSVARKLMWLYSVGRELIRLYSVARKLMWLYSVARELMWLYSVGRELMWLYSVTRELMWLYSVGREMSREYKQKLRTSRERQIMKFFFLKSDLRWTEVGLRRTVQLCLFRRCYIMMLVQAAGPAHSKGLQFYNQNEKESVCSIYMAAIFRNFIPPRFVAEIKNLYRATSVLLQHLTVLFLSHYPAQYKLDFTLSPCAECCMLSSG